MTTCGWRQTSVTGCLHNTKDCVLVAGPTCLEVGSSEICGRVYSQSGRWKQAVHVLPLHVEHQSASVEAGLGRGLSVGDVDLTAAAQVPVQHAHHRRCWSGRPSAEWCCCRLAEHVRNTGKRRNPTAPNGLLNQRGIAPLRTPSS